MPQLKRIVKEELFLSSDEEIADVVHKFEACTLPYVNWTHRAHLAVAVFYSRNMNFKEALNKIRENINTYNNTCGDPEGYNETITILFLKKIYFEYQENKSSKLCYEEVARLSELCTIDWLYKYFTQDLIWSETAKSKWIEPNVKKLDF